MSSFADISFRSQVVFSILVKRIYLKYAHHKVLIQVPGKFGTANTLYRTGRKFEYESNLYFYYISKDNDYDISVM